MGKTPSYPVRIVHFNFKIECAPLRSKPCYFRLVVSENLVVFYARAHRMHTGRTANELCALRKRARRKKINILILIFCSPVGMKTKKTLTSFTQESSPRRTHRRVERETNGGERRLGCELLKNCQFFHVGRGEGGSAADDRVCSPRDRGTYTHERRDVRDSWELDGATRTYVPVVRNVPNKINTKLLCVVCVGPVEDAKRDGVDFA